MSLASPNEVWSVGGLTAHIAGVLRADPALADCAVRGELSNCHGSSAGHWYFTLKDAEAELRCAMFRRDAASLQFTPTDGMAVIARGRIDVYAQRGQYQLIVSSLIHDGLGALYEAFERLRRKLEAEGLFRPERKRPLPAYPQCVAVITSLRGAAVQDMVRILQQRWPPVRILLVDAIVQGAEAVPSLVRALGLVNERDDVDVILFGRGGGSIEDLWAFNEEEVARAVAASRIPVIAAVGHESDVTITDLVADVRAATPTHAAELAVPDSQEVARHLEHLSRRLAALLGRRLDLARAQFDGLLRRPVLARPAALTEGRAQAIDELEARLGRAAMVGLERRRQILAGQAQTLAALSPLGVLERGYAILTRDADGQVVTEPAAFPAGAEGTVRVRGGRIPVAARKRGDE